MLFANDHNDKRIHIDEAQSNHTYYCPFCGAPLITRKGDVRQHHFAHSANHNCSDTWEQNHSYDLSSWHNELQSLFPKVNQEVKLSLGKITHRADVLISRTVVEFQHSIIPVKAFDDRNNFYFNLGYKVVWLFDLSEIYNNRDLEYRKAEDNTLDFKWRNPKRAFNSYDVKSGCIDLFFQLSNEKIVRVYDVSDDGFERFSTGGFISKEEFLNYAGLHNGVCALPFLDNAEKNKEYTEFCKRYGISLNKQQERAVQAVEGANLLLAVPGSGKTTVLVARLGYMVFNKKIDPSGILAITYNRKAAAEMKERFINKFGSAVGNKIHFSTINALCYSIYRRYCREHNIQTRNIIEDNRKVLIRILQKHNGEYPTENDILELEQAIGYIKNMMLNENDILELNKTFEHISEMYKDYQNELKQSNLMDFDDQMVFALYILRKNPEILQAFKSQYKYISVDEAQDTSKIQHTIIKMISTGNNLFMVGDEDQSIYGFRAAYPKALLNFRYDYVNPYIMRMERNYRSTVQIVEKAQQFISKNKGRYEKNMTAERGSGQPVQLIKVQSREDQYSFLLDAAKNNTKETAFLYRDNESAVVIVDSLLREGIPFKLHPPEQNFFVNKIVSDIVAYLKLAWDEYDYSSFERVCNRGILYIKKQQKDYVIEYCKQKNISVLDALEKQKQYIKTDSHGNIDKFKRVIKKLPSLPPLQALDCILDEGYKNYIEKNHYDFGKAEILKILAKNESNIRSFLERLQFLEERIQKGFDTTAENPIILSTIHSSKGLEYDTVYMVDVYDGKFPSSNPNIFSKSKDNSDGEQEERRLFYVGITRAKNSLNLFSIANKNSSYIEELFPAIRAEREEKKRRKQEALQKKNAEQTRLKEIRLKSIYRREIEERAARYRKFEEQRKKEAAELEKKKAAEDQRCLESVLKIIDQQYYPARDQKDRRWVRCEICGAVKQDKDFSSYGGLNHVNLGICSACAKKSRK